MVTCLTHGDPVELLLDLKAILTDDRTWVHEYNNCATIQWIVLVNRLHWSYNGIHTSLESYRLVVSSSSLLLPEITR